MLSRTAANLYWLARYVERAEYLARVLEATLRLTALPLAYVGATNEWESAVATAGCRKAFFARYSEANEENVSEFLAFSSENPSSIRNCIEIARTNARAGAAGGKQRRHPLAQRNDRIGSTHRQRGRIAPHGFGRRSETVERPRPLEFLQVVANQQRPSALTKVPDLTRLVFSGTHTAFEIRH